MSASGFLTRFVRDQHGGAAEFALVLPLVALLFFGIIDAGRYAYEFNQGEKATQTGARFAVVTNPLASVLTSHSYVNETVGERTIAQGDRIPAEALGTISCTSEACACEVTPCPDGTTTSLVSTDFDNLADRMQQIWPTIEDGDITVEYSGSGLGYAGNPSGMDIAPFVTVRLDGMTFTSILLFGSEIDLPDFAYTLTMEDGAGTGSN